MKPCEALPPPAAPTPNEFMFAAEAVLVSEKPARRPLNIGQARLIAEVDKFLARLQHEFQLGQERVLVETGATIKGDQVAVDVVDHLHFRARLRQKHGEPAGKRFDVAGVFRDEWQDPFEESTFAARPADGRPYAVRCFTSQ